MVYKKSNTKEGSWGWIEEQKDIRYMEINKMADVNPTNN